MSGVDPKGLPAREARPPISGITLLLVPAKDCVVKIDPLYFSSALGMSPRDRYDPLCRVYLEAEDNCRARHISRVSLFGGQVVL